MSDESASGATFLLTYNPKYGEIDADDLARWVEKTAGGHPAHCDWSTGSTKRIRPGDRAFLLRQGTAGRGIFASGTFDSNVYTGTHYSELTGIANYAEVLWDTFLYPEDCLPTEVLDSELPQGKWHPLASGTSVDATIAAGLERLWAQHVADVRSATPPGPGSAKPLSEGQGRRLDAQLRGQLEDLAQAQLTQFYEADGWHVEDLRVGNPFDAKATHPDGRVLYLEAKGTTTQGERVIVTRGEVKFAREHPEQCVIGILSGIKIEQGKLDLQSGTLRRYPWDPTDEELDPLQYDFWPSLEDEM